MEGAAMQPILKERVMRTIRTACAVMACAIGLVVAVPSVAVADEGSGTCTAAQRTELRQEMAGLRAQILDLRLTPAEIAAKKNCEVWVLMSKASSLPSRRCRLLKRLIARSLPHRPNNGRSSITLPSCCALRL